jgi:hypothetical protein
MSQKKESLRMNKKSGKSGIVKDIMAKRLTARKSEKALNAVIAHMKLDLWRVNRSKSLPEPYSRKSGRGAAEEVSEIPHLRPPASSQTTSCTN